MMEIDLTRLNNADSISVDETFEVDLEKYQNKDIVELKNMRAVGSLSERVEGSLEVDLTLTGIMVLKDSVTLEPIEKKLDIKIEEEYDLNDSYFKEYYEKEQNILDIMTILWENIVLEVPISLTKAENVELSGEGWTMGAKINNEEIIDPRLEKLTQLLDKGKE